MVRLGPAVNVRPNHDMRAGRTLAIRRSNLGYAKVTTTGWDSTALNFTADRAVRSRRLLTAVQAKSGRHKLEADISGRTQIVSALHDISPPMP